ncbi:MAG: DNA-binding transcriptional regulator Fis [Sedimenticola sp.]
MTLEATPINGEKSTGFSVSKNKSTEPLRECVRDAMTSYFRQLDGHTASDLYQMVISEVEKPLLETVMLHTEGNQTKAASALGISRSTLRKKLAHYGLD